MHQVAIQNLNIAQNIYYGGLYNSNTRENFIIKLENGSCVLEVYQHI